jgi:DNA repair exonuclease SbcCD ATPase subunit
LSYGASWTSIDLDVPGITLITGNNGAGKSTIADALTFVLYGKPYRGINKADLINRINGKNVDIILEFSKGSTDYKIERGISPDYVRIFQNNDLIPFGVDVRDYQTKINEIIGIPYDLFCQVVILGFASYAPFLTLPLSGRRNILDAVSGIAVMSAMQSAVKDRLVDIENDLSKKKNLMNVLTTKIEGLKTLVSVVDTINDEKVKELEAKAKTLEESLSVVKKKHDVASEKLAEFLTKEGQHKELLNTEATKVSDRIREISAEKKVIDSTLRQLQSLSDKSVCPHCFQPIDGEHKTKVAEDYEKKKTDIVAKEQQLKAEWELHTKKMQDFESHAAPLKKTLHGKVGDLEKEKLQISAELASVMKELESLKNKDKKTTVEYESKIVEMSAKLREFENEKSFIENQKDLYLSLSGDLKDTGIRAYILSILLPNFNSDVTELLQGMGMSAIFSLDTSMKDKILIRGRDQTKYEGLSAGEKQRVDMAIMLSLWRFATRMVGMETNLLYFDETLDASLDSTATDYLIDVLGETGKAIYLVTHRKSDDLTPIRHIKAEKINQFSQLKET